MQAPDPPHAESGSSRQVVFGEGRVGIEEIVALARGEASAVLSAEPELRDRLAAGQRLLEDTLGDGRGQVYGVTTGVGASVGNVIPAQLRGELGLNLLRLQGVGTGRMLSDEEAAAVVAARLASLARGYSGVGPELLERLCLLLDRRVLPRIPSEGSVGASGDLTPLSYVGAVLAGEREVSFEGRVVPAETALRRLGVKPLALGGRESLALMNGTAAMTGLACLAFERASTLSALAATITAMVSDTLHGNARHFAARIFELKPHPGSSTCAAWIREHLAAREAAVPARLQDRYSVRCAPHVIGVLIDALASSRDTLEIELNGVDDNPLIDPDVGAIHHGGNFYGGHVCFVMDTLKSAVAGVADLLDRQLSLLCDPATSDGLPENLVAGSEPECLVHHGFKAMQISASALAAEALKLTMPAASFSRSTESHNQDKVSMGTIAARDCLRVLELSERVAGIVLLAAAQAVDLRGAETSCPASVTLRDKVRSAVPMLEQDRRQDLDIERVVALHRAGELPVPAAPHLRSQGG